MISEELKEKLIHALEVDRYNDSEQADSKRQLAIAIGTYQTAVKSGDRVSLNYSRDNLVARMSHAVLLNPNLLPLQKELASAVAEQVPGMPSVEVQPEQSQRLSHNSSPTIDRDYWR